MDNMLRLKVVTTAPQELQLTNGQYNLGMIKNWSIAVPHRRSNPLKQGLGKPCRGGYFQVG